MMYLVYNMNKKTMFNVSIPFFIELISLSVQFFYNSTNVAVFHSIWLTVSVTMLTLYLIFDNFQFYYLGKDTLLHMMPFSNELLLIVKSSLFCIYLWLYSLLGFITLNMQNGHHAFYNFSYFGVPKLISLFSFFLFFNVSLFLIKRILNAKIGLILCIIINIAALATYWLTFLAIFNDKITHWIIGIGASPDAHPLYISLLQLQIISNNINLSLYTTITNFSIGIISAIFFVLLKKFYPVNYLQLAIE